MIDSTLPIKEQIKQLIEALKEEPMFTYEREEDDIDVNDSISYIYLDARRKGRYQICDKVITYLQCILNSKE